MAIIDTTLEEIVLFNIALSPQLGGLCRPTDFTFERQRIYQAISDLNERYGLAVVGQEAIKYLLENPSMGEKDRVVLSRICGIGKVLAEDAVRVLIAKLREITEYRSLGSRCEGWIKKGGKAANEQVPYQEFSKGVFDELVAGMANDVHVATGQELVEGYLSSGPVKSRSRPRLLSSLDKYLDLSLSRYVVLAARPGIGKSAFICMVAGQNARAGLKVGVVSMEMDAVSMALRIIARETGIGMCRLLSGKLCREERDSVLSAATVLKQVTILDGADCHPGFLFGLMYLSRFDLLIIDYFQLMQANRRYEKRYEELTYISRRIKALSKEHVVPVLVVSSVSREQEKREAHDTKPRLGDLADCGSLEKDADAVLFFTTDKEYNDGSRYLRCWVMKNRMGPLPPDCNVPIVFYPETMTFEDT